MAVLGEKLGGGPVDRSADMLRIVLIALFLGSSKVRPTLLGQRERLPCMKTVHEKRVSDVCGLVQEA
jgi:hypothetical protein